MRQTFILCVTLLLIKTSFCQNNAKVENAQERLATFIVREIEKGNSDSIFKYVDPGYLEGKGDEIKVLLTNFYAQFKTLSTGTRRYVTLVWPEGFNLFRFRYIDTTGSVLQIDLSFKKNEINSKIFLLEMVDKLTLQKQREQSKKAAAIRSEEKYNPKYPHTTTLLLRNCHKELRIMTFASQTSFFKWWVFGKTNLESNKVVYFSKDFVLDSNFLRKNIDKVKKSLPPNFWTFPMREIWMDNEPNEDAIWFIQIFARVDKPGKIKIFSAYKMIFEGNDARIDDQRTNPKISDIEFITDQNDLKALEKKLAGASRTVFE